MVKSFYIESLGCAKNQVDSEIMITSLLNSGWQRVDNPARASLLVVNTCGFIEPAKAESIEVCLEFKRLYPDKKLVMAGCLTQRYAAELKHDLPEIDAFWGNKNPAAINQVAGDTGGNNKKSDKQEILKTANMIRSQFLSYAGSVYVKIAEGCNNRCTYCSIPLIRGELKSRPIESIIAEIHALLALGKKEIILVAQDLASFGRDRGKQELLPLLRQILAIKGQYWLRLLYIHPDHFPLPLLKIMEQDERLLPYFDIPFQHVSSRILKNMGRRGSVEKYLTMIQTIRNTLCHTAIRSTLLAGFPGEQDKDFKKLLDFQKQARINWLGVFAYSQEEQTAAYTYKPQLKKSLKIERKEILESRQLAITEDWLQSFVGQQLTVLIEENVADSAFSLGRSWFQAPEVDGLVVVQGSNIKPGTFRRVRVLKRNGLDLLAEAIDEK